MTDNVTPAAVASDWRPNGSDCRLPGDPTNVWARLQELIELSWPTPDEQVELRVLAMWLNPASRQTMLDNTVFDVACEVHNIAQRSDIEFLLPAYAAAGAAWRNISYLAHGDYHRLKPLRPDVDYFDSQESWRATRRQQAFDWWRMVTGVLERLFAAEVVYDFELPAQTSPRLAGVLNEHFSNNLFDSPMAIGASLYTQPLWRRDHSEVLAVMGALAYATKAAGRNLREADQDNPKEFEDAAMWFSFFWQQLKGYAWAAVNRSARGGTSLSFYLNERPEVWAAASEALVDGVRLILFLKAKVSLPAFSSGGRESTEVIADETCGDLIDRMNQILADRPQGRLPVR